QTAQNLFTSKIITDPIDLLERIPDSQIKDKNRLIAKLRQQREQAELLRAAQAPMGGEVMGNAMPPM
ncbi:MAG: hypothetical protein RRY21_06465, partial [Oscillospiraceae bacterium]